MWVVSWVCGLFVGFGNCIDGVGYEWLVCFFYCKCVLIVLCMYVVECLC